MKTAKRILAAVAGAWLMAASGAYGQPTAQTSSDLAKKTRQSLAVVEDLQRRSPGWPTDAHEAILLTYSIDRLSRSEALACNRHIAVIAANAATRITRQDIAKDCPTMSQVLTDSGL